MIPHGEYGGLARTGGSAERAARARRWGSGADAPVTLMFGQLRTDKGLGDLVEAVRRLPALHLLIGGQDAGRARRRCAERSQPQLAGARDRARGLPRHERGRASCSPPPTPSRCPTASASQSGVLLLAYGFHRPVIVYPVGGWSRR